MLPAPDQEVKLEIFDDKEALGAAAAAAGAAIIREAIARRGEATITVATGKSQFEMLERLVVAPDVDWSRVTAFHLDEYIGLQESHPASFRRYLRERFVDRLPSLEAFIAIAGDAPDTGPRSRGSMRSSLGATSMSALPASARIATSPSTIRRPISRPRRPISSWSSTKPAAASSSAKPGSRRSLTCRRVPYR